MVLILYMSVAKLLDIISYWVIAYGITEVYGDKLSSPTFIVFG